MVDWCNELYGEMKDERKCNQLIISGGLKTFLDGYYYTKKSKIPAIYGQASGFLKYAILDYEKLQEYVELQVEGLLMANAYLKINK
jgi:isopentenyl-diphosphate delta-isomerase